MRLTTLSFLVFALAIITGCFDGGKREYLKYQLVNSTDYNIKIECFVNSTNSLNGEILLEKNGGLWESQEQEVSRGRQFHLEMVLNADSLRVIFNDHSVISIVTWDEDYNLRGPFSVLNREKITESEILEIQRYTFTNEDYHRAKPIN